MARLLAARVPQCLPVTPDPQTSGRASSWTAPRTRTIPANAERGPALSGPSQSGQAVISTLSRGQQVTAQRGDGAGGDGHRGLFSEGGLWHRRQLAPHQRPLLRSQRPSCATLLAKRPGARSCEGREGPGSPVELSLGPAPTPSRAGRVQRTVTQGPSSRWLAAASAGSIRESMFY